MTSPATSTGTAPVTQVVRTYRAERAADLWPPLLAAAVAMLLLLWMGGSQYRADLLVLTCTYALIALGMYIPFVLAGSLSLAYSAYAAIGAYGVGIISSTTTMPVWVGWLLGAAGSIVVAVVLSLATRRLSGFFLAAVTLLFGTAFETWLIAAEQITGGSAGIGAIRAPTFLGWEPSRIVQVVLAAVLVLIVTTLVERLRRSPWGVAVRFMREHRSALEASGVRATTMTTVALAVGASVASFGGSLFATFVRGVTPETFTLSIVFLAIFMPLIGGRGTAWGSVVGAVVAVALTVHLALEVSGQLLLAVAVLVILLLAPGGLLGYLDRFRSLVQGSLVRGR